MRFSTRAIHAGQDADPTTGATIVPIYQTSTYTQTGIGEHRGFDYSRTINPTRLALERQLAALDEARFCSAFATGMAATTAVMNILSSGDHVVVGDDLYGGSYRLFSKIFERYGVTFTYVDATNLGDVAAAIRPNTKMLWVETPSNPLLKLTDIAAVALLKPPGALLVVDNTFATAYLQSPLALGADIAVYSTTKYVAGHSDVLGGAAVSNDQTVADTIKFNQNAAGGVPGPLDCFLVLRGAKTLAIRMQTHDANARAVAEFLASRDDVEHVYYPGLPSHPDHELAKRQMRGFGGMVSFVPSGDEARVRDFAKRVKIFSLAESLGGVESLLCHPARMTHGSIPKEDRDRRGVTDKLLRLSVGIEDLEDILDDLRGALDASVR
jgi:cystathionine beta-lyase/cystathionine gamma-synthase